MTSYFDALSAEIAQGPEDPKQYLEHVREIEGRAWATITALTGDREFPDDLREQILGAFAVHGVWQPKGCIPNEKAEARILEHGCYSRLIEKLHDLFHDVARRRHETRFGRLSDHPAFDLARRDDHDEEKAREREALVRPEETR